ADAADHFGLHLEGLARFIIEFYGKEAMNATHIADRSDQNSENNGRESLTNNRFPVSLDELNSVIHIATTNLSIYQSIFHLESTWLLFGVACWKCLRRSFRSLHPYNISPPDSLSYNHSRRRSRLPER